MYTARGGRIGYVVCTALTLITGGETLVEWYRTKPTGGGLIAFNCCVIITSLTLSLRRHQTSATPSCTPPPPPPPPHTHTSSCHVRVASTNYLHISISETTGGCLQWKDFVVFRPEHFCLFFLSRSSVIHPLSLGFSLWERNSSHLTESESWNEKTRTRGGGGR